MTIRQAYESALIEINKIEAPSMLLEDYIYLFNKAIQQKINEIYNRYDVNQQSTDDLSILQITTILNKLEYTKNEVTKLSGYKLPDNYFHLLNCISTFEIEKGFLKCYQNSDELPTETKGCKKLTSDIYPQIISNSYMKPSYKNPYFYVITGLNNEGKSENLIEIHYGLKDKVNVKEVLITYLKTPKYVTLTQDIIDSEIDNSEQLEFPEYMCYEIINTFIKLLLDNASDPRLQTTIPINQSILPMTQGTQQ